MKIVNELRAVHKAGRVLCCRTAQSREVLRYFASLHSSGHILGIWMLKEYLLSLQDCSQNHYSTPARFYACSFNNSECKAMKKLSFIILVLIFCQITASSQSCLPNGITFYNQADIDNFQTNYPNCFEIEGDVVIYGNDITNLNGLNVLTSIWGHLWIGNNQALTSLTGLDNLTSIGGSLGISNTTPLTSLTGLANLTSIGEDLNISNTYSLSGLTGLEGLTSIGGDLVIHCDVLSSFTGLNNLTFIGEDFLIEFNDFLTSLAGLENLTTIGGFLVIYYIEALTSLTGLDNVTSIGGELVIKCNDALTGLTGLNNLTTIGGYLDISDNAALTSLTGLDNIDASSIDNLHIFFNDSLSTCEVLSVCNYLASPNGIIEIHNNAPGCNSQQEVEDACEFITVEEMFPEDYLSLYPNPAKQELKIFTDDGRDIEEVSIYTLTGQRLMKDRPANGIIDISCLQSGMYIVEVTIDSTRIRRKLLVQS